MLTLPVPLHRSRLISFWLVWCAVCALLFGGIAWQLLSPLWCIGGVGVILVGAVIGVLAPKLLFRPYRLWNRMAAALARYVHLWLTGICFYIVVVAVSQTGSSLALARSRTGTSRWVEHLPHATSTPDHVAAHNIETLPSRSWLKDFCIWATQRGHGWALCLLPFLLLLTLLGSEEEEQVFPGSIYTLF